MLCTVYIAAAITFISLSGAMILARTARGRKPRERKKGISGNNTGKSLNFSLCSIRQSVLNAEGSSGFIGVMAFNDLHAEAPRPALCCKAGRRDATKYVVPSRRVHNAGGIPGLEAAIVTS